MPLESQWFLTTVIRVISSGYYRTRPIVSRFTGAVNTDLLMPTDLLYMCWAPLSVQQVLFPPFFFPLCFFSNTEPYFLPLLKETHFFRPAPQIQTSPRLLLIRIISRSTLQHGSQAQARSG